MFLICVCVCARMLGTDVLMKTLAELHDTEGQLCCIIGTVFRKMELQPSILKEISATVSGWGLLIKQHQGFVVSFM